MACSTEPGHPRYYWEVQGYNDQSIYWRHIHQIGLHHAQNTALNGGNWRAVILFLDSAYDPGVATLGPLAYGAKGWLIADTLANLLKKLKQPSPQLNVLRPLVTNVVTVRQEAPRWAREIREATDIAMADRVRLLDLLMLLVVQHFGQMERKEIERMLQLTPIEETKVGQELIELGIEKGIEKGIEQGIEQGEMKILAKLIANKFQIAQEVILARLRRLKRVDFEELSEFLLEAQTYGEISAWVTARTPVEVKTTHG